MKAGNAYASQARRATELQHGKKKKLLSHRYRWIGECYLQNRGDMTTHDWSMAHGQGVEQAPRSWDGAVRETWAYTYAMGWDFRNSSCTSPLQDRDCHIYYPFEYFLGCHKHDPGTIVVLKSCHP
jgi:hypothetical protein